ncbi:TPA: DUF2326 domain-containing protein [Acinetobacter baumannii]|nr:DUF2326 domain-containing protein [Acinetobacter baumannii]HEN9533040.1 DUF2326 domain-containing protein [Acinetobacter baumannii]HEN9568609.1 DUF2326 domain-containing protein [Acinetobacter baumannii]HEO0818061.1 DUF2326 domain-containing protein [Acinetobacter baumannii]
MNLLKIESDLKSFKTINFKPTGLNIILGDDPINASEEGGSNGVGKTLSLGIFHHCMGAKNSIPKIASKMPKKTFTLHYHFNNNHNSITRSALGNEIQVNKNNYKISAFREYLNSSGFFYIPENSEYLTFRSLIKRFARLTKKDCDHPLHTESEKDYPALLNSLHLLGLDISLAIQKKKLKNDLDSITQELNTFKNSDTIKSLILNGKNPKIQLDKTLSEIEALQEKLDNFEVVEDFKEIEKEANNLKNIILKNEREISILEFNKKNILKSLEVTPDISKQDLIEMYEGLESIFKPEILKHFDAVEKFHNTIAENREIRLKNEILEIDNKISKINDLNKLNIKNQQDKINYLQGKSALDEYTTMAKTLVELKNTYNTVSNFLTLETGLNKKKFNIQEQMIQEDRRTLDFIECSPLTDKDQLFKEIISHLYDNAAAGIILENNTGINQLRYNLKIEIDGADSDGIDNARILAFDILNLLHGSNHNINFVWHDNRLFADINPKSRALWFKFILSKLKNTNKQYIASLNNENLLSMREYLTVEEYREIENSIILNLKGDKPENKLLGIQLENYIDDEE